MTHEQLTGALAQVAFDDLAEQLARESRTGRLTLAFPEGDVAVEFRDGRITHVDDERRPERWRLGELLVQGGCLERAELTTALEAQSHQHRYLGALLVERGAVSEGDVKRLLALQRRESLLPLCEETGGAFELAATSGGERPLSPPPLSVAELLREAARYRAEAPDLLALIPSLQMRVRRLRETLALPPKSRLTPRVGEVESRVFLAIRGRPHLVDLTAPTGLTSFELMRALALLLRCGQVELAERPRQSRPAGGGSAAGSTWRDFCRRRPGLIRPLAHLTLAFLLTISSLAAGAHVYSARTPIVSSPPTNARGSMQPLRVLTHSPLDALKTAAQLRRLEAVIEVVRLEEGGYPPSLNHLVEGGRLDPADLSWPSYQETYYYRPAAEGFVLLPPKR